MQPESFETFFDAGRPWRTLVNLYWPERRWVFLAMLAYIFKASPLWVLPVIIANVIDIITQHSHDGIHSLWVNAAVGATVIIQNIPAAMLYVDFLSRAVRNVEIRLRSALIRRLQMLSIGYHGRTDTGILQNKVLRDVESVTTMSQQIVDVGELAIVSILVALAVTAFRVPVFVFVFILFVPLIWVIRKTTARRLQRYNEHFRRELEGMNSLVLGMISMIPVTRAHAAESDEIKRVESQFASVKNAGRAFDKMAGQIGATGWVVLMLFNLCGLVLGAWLSYRKILPLSPGDLVLLSGYFNAIMAAMMQLNAMLPVITRGFDGLRSIGEVLECPDIEENRGKKPVEEVRGAFTFESVSFKYNRNGGNSSALTDISLDIRAGESIGIVGPSGSGKSTFASIVTGFHRPTSGRILLDGVDMNELDLRTYRRRLSIVSQQTTLFNGTLRENIVYGIKHITDEDLQKAIADANATDFVNDLPKALETEIGPAGQQLSGGQRQRISIARALLRNPRILILDEATSALDADSEAVVQQAMERLMVGRTTFIISHRPKLLQRVDHILVFDSGKVVEYK